MKPMAKDERPPILLNKHHRDASVFHPENLLRESRRQKGITIGEVPDVCLLDPDGDIVRWLLANDNMRDQRPRCHEQHIIDIMLKSVLNDLSDLAENR